MTEDERRLDGPVAAELDPADQSAHGGDLSGGALTNAGLPGDVPADRDVAAAVEAARPGWGTDATVRPTP